MSDINVRIPIEVIVRVGAGATSTQATIGTVSNVPAGSIAREAIPIDEDYSSREGYDEAYLGNDLVVPFPTLTSAAMKLASVDPDAEEEGHILRYHHFSLVMNKKRRLLFFAACNTTRDPKLIGTKSRKDLGRDQWILDPRIPAGHQVTTKELYGPEIFDRGHVVRREDGYWGETDELADFANYDTFHYTNCTPQHPEYNQSSKDGIWGLLENHIAKEADVKELKLSIFAGPVLKENDPSFRGVKVPRQFWKIVLGARKNGTLGAWAFLLSQSKLVTRARDEEAAAFEPGDFETYQLPIRKIVDMLEVRFDERVIAADTYEGGGREGAPAEPRPIRALTDVRL